jgi:Zn-dependent protease with chaperone function
MGLDISTPWAWRRLPNCFRRGGSAPYHHLTMPQPLQVRVIALALAAALLSGCATVPTGAYFPPPTNPATVRVADILHRAAVAAGDDPERYSFAFVQSRVAAAYSDEEAVFYFTDGLVRMPRDVIEAVVAHEVAHEVLGHIGDRRRLSLSIFAGFTLLGVVAPGVGLLDFIVNPVAVRAFSRHQELAADRRAVEILRAMGHASPESAMAGALRALDATSPRPKEGLAGLLSTHPSLEERLGALGDASRSAARSADAHHPRP